MLRPGAYRADLWRAAVLWKYGGLYLDHKLIMIKPLGEWLDLRKTDHAIFAQDDPRLFTHSLWNAVAYSSNPNLAVYACILRQIVNNVATRTYSGYLEITGPQAWYAGAHLYATGK